MKCHTPCLLLLIFSLVLSSCESPESQRARLKKEIKQELLAELKQQQPTQQRACADEKRASTRKESREKPPTQPEKQHPSTVPQKTTQETIEKARPSQRPPTLFGSAEGTILRKGRGLPGCHVKLVRIIRSWRISELAGTIAEGVEFVTVTDEKGTYRFPNIPVGEYKIKWQPPGDTGWIRRLRQKPDVIIKEGETARLKAIDIHRALVPH